MTNFKKVILALSLGLLIGSAGTAMAATSDTVQAVFAKFNFVVNGETKQLAIDPLVVDGTSYLPVREVAGLLGYQLDYDDDTRTIILRTLDRNGTIQSNNNKGGNDMKGDSNNLVQGQLLLNFIAEKYNQTHKDGLSLGIDQEDDSFAYIRFNGEKIKLKIFGNLVDASPFIEAKIISIDEHKSIQQLK